MTDFVPLQPHPTTPAPAVHALAVQVVRQADGTLALRYRLDGELASLRIPPPAAPAREDGLWAHTCFELFVARQGAAAYREYNFAPSGQWAAYAFAGYRARADDPGPSATPTIRVEVCDGRLELDVRIPAPQPPDAVLELGLTAVVEATDGSLSCWALHHADARPDFHRRDSFVLALGGAEAPSNLQGKR